MPKKKKPTYVVIANGPDVNKNDICIDVLYSGESYVDAECMYNSTTAAFKTNGYARVAFIGNQTRKHEAFIRTSDRY